MTKLLLIDDELNVLYGLEKALTREGMQIVTAQSGQEALIMQAREKPDVAICDVRLPDTSGLDLFLKLRAFDPKLPVIIITAHATTDTAIEAMKRGAFDYLLKPFKLDELRAAVDRAIELSRLSRVPTVFDDSLETAGDDLSSDRIVGASEPMQKLYKQIGRVAAQDVNVLLLGESGTGKELVARAIYQHSTRSDKPFLAINCAAIPEHLLESELFGHEKGAFTGADRRRIGKFEQANGGTIFLDEIGDMSMHLQAKLLRVLQDGQFERVGSNEVVHSQVRIIAATNRDLNSMIINREFREDLFYRLNTFTIHLPPLRDRLEDLPLLTRYFIERHGQRMGRSSITVPAEFLDTLAHYRWPGNIRELQNAIRYALVETAGDVLIPANLPSEVVNSVVNGLSDKAFLPSQAEYPEQVSRLPLTVDVTFPHLRNQIQHLLKVGQTELSQTIHGQVDEVLLQEVLAYCNGHQTRAAELLGISRTTLRSRLASSGMAVERAITTREMNNE